MPVELLKTKLINDANLQAYYRLENGALLVDSSGKGNTLTNVNSTAEAAGLIGGGADFGAANTNKNLQILSKVGFTNPTDPCTISAWVKLNTEIASGTYTLFCKTIYGANYSQIRADYDYNSGTRRLRIGINGSGAFATVNYNINLGTTNWYHIVLVFAGGTTGAIRAYLNGTYIGTVNASLGSSYAGTDGFWLNMVDGVSWPSSSMIDDVAVFNRVLINSEVEELYYGRSQGEYVPNNNTKLLCRMNCGIDSSGNNAVPTYDGLAYDKAYARIGARGAHGGGATNCLEFPANVDLSGNFTISLWFRGAETSSWRWLLSSYIAAGAGILITTSGNAVRVSMGGWFLDKVTAQPWLLSSATDWYNLIITRTGTTIDCYVNGGHYGTAGTSSSNVTGPVEISRVHDGTNYNYFVGDIDEVIMETVAWTAQQVRNYFKNARGLFAPKIV